MKHDTARIFEDFINKAEDMNARLCADTERNRKRRASITVKAGNAPAAGAEIKLTQKTHEFKFGGNLFMLGELETPEKNAEYKKLFANVFNLATLPFYWDTLEPVKGQPRYAKDSPRVYRRPAPDLCIEYCRENGIEPKLHCLGYDYFTPTWYKNASVAEGKRLLENRMREISGRYADLIPDMEVTNEHFSWDVKRSSRFYLSEGFCEWCYDRANEYFPLNNLVINEGPNETWWKANTAIERSAYYLLVEKLLASHRRIDKIGFQYHIWQYKEDDYENTRTIFDPELLFKYMDTFGKFGRELQVTETTFPAKGNLPEDEEYQAEVLEKLYRIWFSHKDMQAIIYWNLVDGYAHGAQPGDMTNGENKLYGGLINFDFTPKKSYERLAKLVNEEWRSNGTALCSADGKTDFRGFCGRYEAEITYGDRKYTREIEISKYLNNNVTIEL